MFPKILILNKDCVVLLNEWSNGGLGSLNRDCSQLGPTGLKPQKTNLQKYIPDFCFKSPKTNLQKYVPDFFAPTHQKQISKNMFQIFFLKSPKTTIVKIYVLNSFSSNIFIV